MTCNNSKTVDVTFDFFLMTKLNWHCLRHLRTLVAALPMKWAINVVWQKHNNVWRIIHDGVATGISPIGRRYRQVRQWLPTFAKLKKRQLCTNGYNSSFEEEIRNDLRTRQPCDFFCYKMVKREWKTGSSCFFEEKEWKTGLNRGIFGRLLLNLNCFCAVVLFVIVLVSLTWKWRLKKEQNYLLSYSFPSLYWGKEC